MVFQIGQTQVHLDRVDGLGEFLELEVAVGNTFTPDTAAAEAHRLVAVFGIADEALVKGAYVDLLENAHTHRSRRGFGLRADLRASIRDAPREAPAWASPKGWVPLLWLVDR